MTPFAVDDVVVSPAGRKWRVIDVAADFVRVQEIETGVVSHIDPDDLRKA